MQTGNCCSYLQCHEDGCSSTRRNVANGLPVTFQKTQTFKIDSSFSKKRGPIESYHQLLGLAKFCLLRYNLLQPTSSRMNRAAEQLTANRFGPLAATQTLVCRGNDRCVTQRFTRPDNCTFLSQSLRGMSSGSSDQERLK